MSRKRMIATVGGTVACAFGIGFFMQHGETARAPAVVPQPAPVFEAGLAPLPVMDEASLVLQEITLVSAQPDLAPSRPDPVMVTSDAAELPPAPKEPQMPRLGCDVAMTATPAALAMVDLSVIAPCNPNDRVTVHHNGMMFTDSTDTSGNLSVTVPALSANAVFIVAFGNGKGAVAAAAVPELDSYDRVVLQWAGDSGFQMHAREFGAGYGEDGHVWSGAPHSARDSLQGDHGTVVRLGKSGTLMPKIAEIYTFPSGMSHRSGTITVSIEAEVTRANCGRDITAQSLELRKDATLRTRDLVLSVPDCSALGDFLVLNNLVNDLKIAAR